MKLLFKKIAASRFAPVLLVVLLVIAISFATRVALLLQSGANFSWTFTNLAGSFVLGLFYDLAMSAYLIIPFTIHIWLTNEKMYKPKWRWFTLLALLFAIALFSLTNIVSADFNKGLHRAIIIYFIARLVIFSFLMFKTAAFRKKWRTYVLYVDFFILIFLLLFNAASEWFFWEEFSTRYNFIAVDYLVYTNEVIGNIQESYPIPLIILSVAILTTGVFLLVRPLLRNSVYAPSSFYLRTLITCCLLSVSAISYFTVKEEWKNFSKNEYANELAGNGIFEFGSAYWHNELDFFKFYKTLPDQEAFSLVRNALAAPNARFTSNDTFSLERQITYPQPEMHYNVVLISVESLSASFMKYYGSTRNITPCLDSLASKSLFFTNLYASGTRTVKGLEALSLAIPPTPGQSIVKRPDNENLFTLGSVFASKGYIAQYIYGGYGYFDNMNYFFSHNNYQVIDREALKDNEITYQNIWGVADEDLFTLAERTLDSNYKLGKPFFSQIMTVSNHRPFTYPDGRIDIPSKSQSREGAVKYTDYAINRFIKEASARPWFDSTIFIIVADHCASSAGSVELPVKAYHIPLLMYAPKILQPQVVSRLMSQIDIAPTVLGLLKFSYRSKFLGQDIFTLPEGKENAFISTYQSLGFLYGNKLIIQSPVRKVKEYEPDFATGAATEVPLNDSLAKEAIAYYQVASWLLKHKAYGK
jgi:phosphoglycerol transferase MdoB-like AlkP superfamily enzyme